MLTLAKETDDIKVIAKAQKQIEKINKKLNFLSLSNTVNCDKVSNERNIMTKLSYEDQDNAIVSVLEEEIDRLKSLPKEEAKLEAHKGLVKVGIIDEAGNYTPPYVELKKLMEAK